jgi:DNA-binding transcriptional MerR regulator
VAKGPDAFRTISEAADELGVPQHVLRFWETKFSFIRPMKRAGGRRFYRRQDIDVLRGVRRLLYDDGYTIKGVQRLHKEQGVRRLVDAGDADAPTPPPMDLHEFAAAPVEEVARPVLGQDAHARLQGVLGDIEGVKNRIDALLAKR